MQNYLGHGRHFLAANIQQNLTLMGHFFLGGGGGVIFWRSKRYDGYFFLQLTWVSDRLRFLASSFLSCPTTYWFFSKACSSFRSWFGENAVRIRLGFRKGNKNSGKLGPAKRTFRKLNLCSHISNNHILLNSKILVISDDEQWGFNGERFDGVYMKARQLRAMPHSSVGLVGMPGTLPAALALLNSRN